MWSLDILRLFAIALVLGILANIFPDFIGCNMCGELFEILSIGFIGAIGWEIYRTKPWKKDDSTGLVIKNK